MKSIKRLIILLLIPLVLISLLGVWAFTDNVQAKFSNVSIIQRSLPSNISLKELAVINGGSLHRSKNQQYRIYSHHFLAIEHRDLNYLTQIGNRYATDTNNVYMDQYNQSYPIYRKFHDGNYWSVFKDQQCPKNFKHSHMSNYIYNLVNQRVLKSHGVHSGVNFDHSDMPRLYSLSDN